MYINVFTSTCIQRATFILELALGRHLLDNYNAITNNSIQT